MTLHRDIALNTLSPGNFFVYGADCLGSPGLKYGIVLATKLSGDGRFTAVESSFTSFTVTPSYGGWDYQGYGWRDTAKKGEKKPKTVSMAPSNVLVVLECQVPDQARILLKGLYNKFSAGYLPK